MDISKSSIQELKSIAYDIMGDITRLNQNLQIVQQEIAKRQREDKTTQVATKENKHPKKDVA